MDARVSKKNLLLMAGVKDRWDKVERDENEVSVLGLEDEINKVLPDVEETVKAMSEEDAKKHLKDLLLTQIGGHAKVELAAHVAKEIRVMYDNRRVSNKRAKIRQKIRELESLLQII